MRRPVNEDSVATPKSDVPAQLLARKGHLFVVADGLGGHREGKTASDLAARMVMQEYYADPEIDVRQSLSRAIQAANREVHQQAQTPGYEKMGTTIVAAVVQGNDLVTGHVGDSRAYLIRPGETRSLTQDHTWIGEQLRAGVLTPEQAESHEHRHILTRSVGREEKVTVTVGQITLRPDDYVVLCSDGLWEQVAAGEIEATVLSETPGVAAQSLVDLANQRGGRDNTTVVVIEPRLDVEPQPTTGTRNPVKEKLAELSARFSALPARTRALAGGAAALILVAIIAWLVISTLLRQGDSAPPPRVGPIQYEARPGDTRQAIASYFQVMPGVMPAEITAGLSMQLQPGRFAVLLSGRAGNVQADGSSASLEVSARTQKYQILVDLQNEEARVVPSAEPENGDRVAVFGEFLGDGSVRAAVVDVYSRSEWGNWYQTALNSDVWVYSAFHRHLLRTPSDAPELEGHSVVVLGRWQPGDGVTRFEYEVGDLFVLQEEDAVYRSWLPEEGRQPLPAPIGPTATGGAPAEPEVTTTPEPPVALSILGEINEQGVFVRVLPDTDNTPLSTLTLGTEVYIQCQSEGEVIQGTGIWYLVTHSGDQEGYVFAPFVTVTSSLGTAGIPVCQP
jgi:serine/threonine protein phosphatase PrpC